MNDHAARLINNCKIVIFKNNVKRNILRSYFRFLSLRDFDNENFSCCYAVILFYRTATQGNGALFNEPRRL